MSRSRSGRSILSQTFWLLVAGMILVQLVIAAGIFLLPPPREEGVPLGEIAERLGGNPASESRWHVRDLDLPVRILSAPPRPQDDLIVNIALNAELAERLRVPSDDIRIYFRADEGSLFWRQRRHRADGIVRWRGEPMFFDRAIAAVRIGSQWRMISIPDRPLIAEWQKRMALLFGIALLSLIPLAWLFARRLVRPIRAFSDAADRVGHDASAPMITEEGPAELRVAARAFNAMQSRITEQLREREAMVGAIAHDLRTPLSRVAFRIEAASDALREPIQRDIEQMKGMITATLDYVRGGQQQGGRTCEQIDLAALVGGIIEDERHVGRPVRWRGKQPVPYMVNGDPVALGRMVQNLVDNAVKYGGEAEVYFALEGNGGGAGASIVIADRGPGLAPDEVEAMFAPFARQERSRNRETGGAGLGLAIARNIARDHGGNIALLPREGGGLEAWVTLPR